MAKQTAVVPHQSGGNLGFVTHPVSIVSPWHIVNTDCATVVAPQNSGNPILDPFAVDNDANIFTVDTAGRATTIELMAKYVITGAIVSQCSVNVFGVDENGIYQKLADENGDVDIELTATVATDTVQADDELTTPPIRVDLRGNRYYEVHIVTRLNATTEAGAVYAREY